MSDKFYRVSLKRGAIYEVYTLLHEDFTPEGLRETEAALADATLADGDTVVLCPEHGLEVSWGEDEDGGLDFSGVVFVYANGETDAFAATATFRPDDDCDDAGRRLQVLYAVSTYGTDHEPCPDAFACLRRSIFALAPCAVQAFITAEPAWAPETLEGGLCAQRFLMYAGSHLLQKRTTRV